MSLSKIRRKKQKGFTLIELMIVIAVIAILAAVLIPRSGVIQNTAKESGIEANMRTVEGVVNGMIHRYPAARVAQFGTDLQKKLDGEITNPINNSDDVEFKTNEAESDVAGTESVCISNDNNAPAAPSDPDKFAGLIWVRIYDDSGTTVKITGYDANGTKLPDEVTVKRVGS